MKPWVRQRLAQFPTGPGIEGAERVPAEAMAVEDVGGLACYRVAGDVPRLQRGLVVTEEATLPAHPHVRRAYHLSNAIAKYYYNPFYVEERAPGAEVRVARIDGRVLAFTRDGRWCPFTTDRIADLMPTRLFDDRPELVLCGCIDGAETPYVASPSTEEPLVLRVFDFLELGEPWPLPPEECYALLDEHGLDGVRRRGRFTSADLDAVRSWVRELADAGVDTVIAKPIHRQHRPLKAATPAAVGHSLLARSDVAGGSWDGRDEPFTRAGHQLRGLLSLVEHDVPVDEVDWARVGRRALQPLLRAAHAVGRDEPVSASFSAWFHDRAHADAMVERLRAGGPGVEVEVDDPEPEGDGWRLRFRRRLVAVEDYLSRRLSGVSFLE